MTNMTWSLWLLVAIFAASVEKVVSRRTLANTQEYWSYMKGFNLGGLVILLFFFEPQPLSLEQIGLLVLCGLLWFWGCAFSFRADQHSPLANTSLVAQLQLILVCVGGVIFFGEDFSAGRLLGTLLILIGLSQHLSNIKLGIGFKTISALTMAGTLLLGKYLTTQVPPSTIALFGFLVPLLISTAWSPQSLQPAFLYARRVGYANVWMGAVAALTYFALINAVARAPISLVMPVYQINVLLTLLLGSLWLKERELVVHRWKETLAVVCGAIILQW